MEVELEVDLATQEILLAASNHDIPKLRTLLRNSFASVQDAESGFTPLHAAIAACADDDEEAPSQPNGTEHALSTDQQETIAQAERTVKFLLQNGAIWNDLDARGETPGCLALRLKLKGLYEVMVDAGVRAEMLMNRLDAYESLDDEDDDVEDAISVDGAEFEVLEVVEDQDSAITIDGAGDPPSPPPPEPTNDDSTTNPNYLASTLRFQDDRLLDSAHNGVMMSWESDIMARTTSLLVPLPSLTVLNIGHGMGIIDTMIQAKSPAAHHIIEAHPQVQQQMRRDGWFDKPNTTVHEGRWQDVLPQLINQGTTFDAIYFDTFAENYKAFRHFFNEFVIGLLKPEGLWGWFHGLGADRQISYDVYTKVVEMDVFEAGFDVEWETVAVPDLEQSEEWTGVRRRYWALDTYRLPICRFVE